MDNNFQTSFIPKKPLSQERMPATHHTSIYMFVATVLFFLALASAAGVYLYKAALTKNIASMDASLTAARNSFEPSLITQLQTLDRRMTDANILLSTHISISPIFAALEASTLKSVQFTKFTYDTPSADGSPITINMSGRAQNYTAIALESDQLATNPDIHDPIFSNLALDDTSGTVTFDLTFTVDPALVSYKNNLPVLSTDAPAPASTAPASAASSDGTTPAAGTSTSPSTQTSTAPAQASASDQSTTSTP